MFRSSEIYDSTCHDLSRPSIQILGMALDQSSDDNQKAWEVAPRFDTIVGAVAVNGDHAHKPIPIHEVTRNTTYRTR